jgi:hypothetical protein
LFDRDAPTARRFVRLTPRVGALVVLAALAVSACGGSGGSSSTSTSGTAANTASAPTPVVARFLARVNHSCHSLDRRNAMVPLPLDPVRQPHYLAVMLAAERRNVTTLESWHAPPQLAIAYGQFKRYLEQAVNLAGRGVAAITRRDRGELPRLESESLSLQRRASVFSGEIGLWGCAVDAEAERYQASNAHQQLIAGLDEICAPAVAADWNVGTDEVVAVDQAKAGAISRKAARARLASDLGYASLATQEAASRLGQLQAPLGQEELLRDMIGRLQQYAQVTFGASKAFAAGEPIDVPGLQDSLSVPARQAGLDAVRLHAGECEEL